jgi:hypothetical protein
MGFLHDYPQASPKEVLWDVCNGMSFREYLDSSTREEIFLYGDYIFGRSVKLGISITKDVEEHNLFIVKIGADISVDPEYQTWAVSYSSYQDLVRACAIPFSLE